MERDIYPITRTTGISLFLFYFLRGYLFISRGRGKEGEREKE